MFIPTQTKLEVFTLKVRDLEKALTKYHQEVLHLKSRAPRKVEKMTREDLLPDDRKKYDWIQEEIIKTEDLLREAMGHLESAKSIVDLLEEGKIYSWKQLELEDEVASIGTEIPK